MFDKVKEWVADFKVWATAAIAFLAEWTFGIIDILKGLFN